MARSTPSPVAAARASSTAARRGFTVVELLVVTVIIMILASLTFSGLAVVRQRARVSATRSTIRKLHEIVMPHYETYLRRRVPFATTSSATTNARNRLVNLRTLTLREMPDTLGATSDVFVSGSQVLVSTTSSTTSFLRTGPVFAYANAWASGSATFSAANASAECLYMVVARGGLEPDVMEQFRRDEIGDVDRDGWPEFRDAWNTPIQFWRWAPGFSASPGTPGRRSIAITGTGVSMVQFADPLRSPDPFDPQRADSTTYAFVPLIASGGPDRNVGLVPSIAWNGQNLSQLITVTTGTIGGPTSTAATAHRDNITNHDFSGR